MGFEPKYHVTGSRDEKTDTTTELLGCEISHKDIQTYIKGTFENSKCRNNFFAQIFRDCRSLKCSYLLMVAVGGCLIARYRCGKMCSSILEGSRHPTSPNPSRNLAISDENMIFDKNLWFFEKFFWLKIFLRPFYLW